MVNQGYVRCMLPPRRGEGKSGGGLALIAMAAPLPHQKHQLYIDFSARRIYDAVTLPTTTTPMRNAVRRLLPVPVRKLASNFLHTRRQRQRYKLHVARQSDEWSQLTIEDGASKHNLALPLSVRAAKAIAAVLPRLHYSRHRRLGWAAARGAALCRYLGSPGRELNLLFVGYGGDTWDAQLVHK